MGGKTRRDYNVLRYVCDHPPLHFREDGESVAMTNQGESNGIPSVVDVQGSGHQATITKRSVTQSTIQTIVLNFKSRYLLLPIPYTQYICCENYE